VLADFVHRLRNKYQAIKFMWDPRSDPLGVELIWRKSGPITYLAQIIANPLRQQDFAEVLLTSDLSWYWSYDNKNLTFLTEESAVLLLDVIRAHAFGAFYGFDKDTAAVITEPARLDAALKAFSVYEQGPLHIAIVHYGDLVHDYIFIPHNHVLEVRKLLSLWGLSKEYTRRVSKDREDRGQFEYWFHLPPRESMR
jgi:hypothetical protein